MDQRAVEVAAVDGDKQEDGHVGVRRQQGPVGSREEAREMAFTKEEMEADERLVEVSIAHTQNFRGTPQNKPNSQALAVIGEEYEAQGLAGIGKARDNPRTPGTTTSITTVQTARKGEESRAGSSSKAEALLQGSVAEKNDDTITRVTRTINSLHVQGISEVAEPEEPAGPPAGTSKPSQSQSCPPHISRVYILRHGERLDEVPQNTWRRDYVRSHGRRFDPPLTEVGQQQAARAATFIASKRFDVDVMYTSALVRCVSTASVVADKLGLRVIVCDPLAECAAAVRERTLTGTALASDAELHALVAGDRFMHRHVTPALCFRDALVELCHKHAGQSFLVCSHREAIRDLLLEQHQTARLGYCAVAAFEYNHQHDTFRLIDANRETVSVVNLKRTGSLW